jgi:GTP pyrophosphokinase
MVPLKYQLNTGDTVEIITSVHQRPSKDWLKFVKTGRARAKIRHYVLAEERERSIEIGRESVDRELKKWKIDLNRVEKEGEILKLANELSFKTEADFYAAIGYGRVSPKIVVTKLVPAQEREKAKSVVSPEVIVPTKRADRKSGVKVQGLLDVMVNFARCCNPLPGDSIRGYVTRGRGVTVHKDDCENLKLADRKRIVDVSWDEGQPVTRTVGLTVEAENRTGLLAAISGVFSSNDSDIIQANVKTVNDAQALGVFQISVRNLEHLTRIINALRGLKGVTRVERMGKA